MRLNIFNKFKKKKKNSRKLLKANITIFYFEVHLISRRLKKNQRHSQQGKKCKQTAAILDRGEYILRS